jgi:hypothetical protein
VLKRILIVLAVAFSAAALAQSASALTVSVRVEGKTQTIFGSTEPRLRVAATALDALVAASRAGEFYYHLADSSLGSYVDQIGLYPALGSSGWMFKVNGALPPVGANEVALRDGDRVLWYWAGFDPVTYAGPKTLFLRRSQRNCYAVLAEDDKGGRTPAAGAVLHVGSRRTVRAAEGRACVGGHAGLLVRATLSGAIRSNALT